MSVSLPMLTKQPTTSRPSLPLQESRTAAAVLAQKSLSRFVSNSARSCALIANEACREDFKTKKMSALRFVSEVSTKALRPERCLGRGFTNISAFPKSRLSFHEQIQHLESHLNGCCCKIGFTRLFHRKGDA